MKKIVSALFVVAVASVYTPASAAMSYDCYFKTDKGSKFLNGIAADSRSEAEDKAASKMRDLHPGISIHSLKCE